LSGQEYVDMDARRAKAELAKGRSIGQDAPRDNDGENGGAP